MDILDQMEKNNTREDLINDLTSVITVMEELYQYHPSNPNRKDLVKEYEVLENIRKDIEAQLDSLKS